MGEVAMASDSGSLACRPHQDLETDMTEFGFLVYAGTVRDLHEWEFRAISVEADEGG